MIAFLICFLFAILASKKVSQEFLFNQIGWIASPDEDKDSMYDFNVRYVWKVIAAVTTAVVTTDPFVVDLIGTFDEKGACIGDKIKVSPHSAPYSILAKYLPGVSDLY